MEPCNSQESLAQSQQINPFQRSTASLDAASHNEMDVDTSNSTVFSSTLSDREQESETRDITDKVEKDLSEDELRRLFDDEEIERFLGLFADVS